MVMLENRKQVSLISVCLLNMGQSPNSETYNKDRNGLPFYQGNADFGRVYPITKTYCAKPVKIAEPDDVLLSVRAPIGAVNIADTKCCIGRGLAALKATSKIDGKYLYYVMKNKENELNEKGTGSTFKAVTKATLESVELPVYSLENQKQIAAILDKASELIELRKQQLAKMDLLIKSKFIAMFGDPVTNPMGWDTLMLCELGEVSRGVSKHRPRNDPQLLGGEYPLIQTGEVANAGLYIRKYSSTYSEMGLKQSRLWKAGTLCITIAANIAKTAILSFEACFPDSVVGFKSNIKTNQYFIHFWFEFFQEILEKQAPESAQKNINLKILNELMVIVPSIELQNEFAAFVDKVEQQKAVMQASLAKLEINYKALMQQYFG